MKKVAKKWFIIGYFYAYGLNNGMHGEMPEYLPDQSVNRKC